MNIVVDTNVLLSAALRDRLPEKVVIYVATNDECRWLVSAEILKEYLDVLQRPKFSLPPELVQAWSELIQMRTILVSSPPIVAGLVRDPKDVIFFSTAIAASADFLITGDDDLLTATTTAPTRIISVTDFAALVQIN